MGKIIKTKKKKKTSITSMKYKENQAVKAGKSRGGQTDRQRKKISRLKSSSSLLFFLIKITIERKRQSFCSHGCERRLGKERKERERKEEKGGKSITAMEASEYIHNCITIMFSLLECLLGVVPLFRRMYESYDKPSISDFLPQRLTLSH